jgi:hypothetical protein
MIFMARLRVGLCELPFSSCRRARGVTGFLEVADDLLRLYLTPWPITCFGASFSGKMPFIQKLGFSLLTATSLSH